VSDLIEPPAGRRPEEALELMSQAVSDGDIEAALAQYEGSAVLARWPGRPSDGDRDVRGALADLADLRLPLSVRVASVLEAPGLALVICERRVAGTGPDGELVRLYGHGCAVVRPQPDGAWRIAVDAWRVGAEFPPDPPEIPPGMPGDAVPGEGMAGSLTTKACLSARNGTRR
jgi:ketosteroid isomerase-like protein